MPDLSLFGLQAETHALMDEWQNADTPEKLVAAELAIHEHIKAEVRKVDGISQYIRGCKSRANAAKYEAEHYASIAQQWTAREQRIKDFVFNTMKLFEKTKLFGAVGSLAIKGNGGLKPLVISDESLIPLEYQDAKPVPNKDRIRRDLEKGIGVPGAYLAERSEHLEVR